MKKYVVDLWKRSQAKIGKWMQGQLLLGLLIGVLVYLGLTILGVKYAFTLAIFYAVAELIPIFGPIIAWYRRYYWVSLTVQRSALW